MELLAGGGPMIYRFDAGVLDTERRELRRNGVLGPLETQVLDLLEFR